MAAAKKTTKKPAATKAACAPDYQVDRMRAGLSYDSQQEFDGFILLEPSWNDIAQWVRDRTGEDIPIAHVAAWRKANAVVGPDAKELNASFTDYDGLDIHRAAIATLGFSLEFLEKIKQRFIFDDERFNQLSTIQAVGMVPGMIREVRSLIQQLEQKTMAYDAMQQELGGAAFALQELLATHRDTALEEPLKALAPEIFRKIRSKYTGIN